MAFHFHGMHPRSQPPRMARQGAGLLLLLLFVAIAALWMTGASTPSLLPIEPPA